VSLLLSDDGGSSGSWRRSGSICLRCSARVRHRQQGIDSALSSFRRNRRINRAHHANIPSGLVSRSRQAFDPNVAAALLAFARRYGVGVLSIWKVSMRGVRRCPAVDGVRAEQRKHIDPERAMTDLPPSSLINSDTVYFCVVDRDRNAVSSSTRSIHGFGSSIVTPNTGNRAAEPRDQLPCRPRHPNCIAPGQAAAPHDHAGMAMKDGRAVMPYGVMGRRLQPFGHTHLLTNILDFGCDLQEALDLARVFYAGEVRAGRARRAAGVRHRAWRARPPRGAVAGAVRRRPGDLDRLAERRAPPAAPNRAWMAARWAFKCLPRQVDARRNALRNMS